MRDGADPTGTVAGDLGDLASGFSLGQQPNDLPVAALHWVFCLPIAGLDVFATLMGFYGDALVHLSSVSQDLILVVNGCILFVGEVLRRRAERRGTQAVSVLIERPD